MMKLPAARTSLVVTLLLLQMTHAVRCRDPDAREGKQEPEAESPGAATLADELPVSHDTLEGPAQQDAERVRKLEATIQEINAKERELVLANDPLKRELHAAESTGSMRDEVKAVERIVSHAWEAVLNAHRKVEYSRELNSMKHVIDAAKLARPTDAEITQMMKDSVADVQETTYLWEQSAQMLRSAEQRLQQAEEFGVADVARSEGEAPAVHHRGHAHAPKVERERYDDSEEDEEERRAIALSLAEGHEDSEDVN